MAISAVHLFIITAGLLNSAFAVTYGCDPFYSMIQERQQTCVCSNVSYNASQDYLTVFSSFSDCENRNESESASIFFSDRNYQWTVRIDPGSEFYFEYTIMWTSPESNCVVDLTPNGPSTNSDPVTSWDMVDQNGISNNPLENLTDFALNKPYTRRFILSVSAPRSYRFGFTCARPNGEILTNDQQTAIISRIMYGMTDETAHWDRAVFEPSWMGSHCTTNTSCTDPAPHEDTTCVIDGSWSDPVWYYNGSYYASTYTPSAGFNGDFYVDEIAWTDSYILGCIHPWRQNNVTIVLHPDWSMRLRFGQGKQCDMFPYTIEGRQRPNNAPLPQGFSSNCDYVLDQAKVSIDYESTTSMTFSAPLSAWTAIECTETPETLTLMPSSQNGYNAAGANAIWVLIFCLVGAALLIVGAVLGIVFGLRKRRQRQQKKDEKKPPSTSAEETETKPSERR